MNIAHLINPVKANAKSDLQIAQPITFESMLKSKELSKFTNNIQLYAIGYEEDIKNLPEEFIVLPELKKSVQNVNLFSTNRKLPLLKDLLTPIKNLESIDYIIYTNVDIGVMPFFYDFLFQQFKSGSDSLIINKRIIEYSDSIEKMFSQIGKSHPGYDCFVFKKSLLDNFQLEDICIGARYIGLIFYLNLLVFSHKLEILTDKHLTFHIGDDRSWDKPNFSEYERHNAKEALDVIHKLIEISSSKDELKELKNYKKKIDLKVNKTQKFFSIRNFFKKLSIVSDKR